MCLTPKLPFEMFRLCHSPSGGDGYSDRTLGALVIGSLDNGLDLLNQPQSVKSIVQGAVLLLAVTVDAVVRRSGLKSGR